MVEDNSKKDTDAWAEQRGPGVKNTKNDRCKACGHPFAAHMSRGGHFGVCQNCMDIDSRDATWLN